MFYVAITFIKKNFALTICRAVTQEKQGKTFTSQKLYFRGQVQWRICVCPHGKYGTNRERVVTMTPESFEWDLGNESKNNPKMTKLQGTRSFQKNYISFRLLYRTCGSGLMTCGIVVNILIVRFLKMS